MQVCVFLGFFYFWVGLAGETVPMQGPKPARLTHLQARFCPSDGLAASLTPVKQALFRIGNDTGVVTVPVFLFFL